MLAKQAVAPPAATILPALLRLFEEKVGQLRETLNDETVRGEEAADPLSSLIERVMIYPQRQHAMIRWCEGFWLVGTGRNDKRRPSGRRVSFDGVWLRGQDLNL